MGMIFAFLALAAFAAIPVGLIAPRFVLPNLLRPSQLGRMKVLAIYPLLGVVCLIIGVSLRTPEQGGVAEKAPSAQVAAATNGASSQARGLGVSRFVAFSMFKEQGYTLRPTSAVNGQDRWMAKGDTGLVEVIGPENDLLQMTVAVAVPANDQRLNAAVSHLSTMIRMSKLALPEWDAAGFLNAGLQQINDGDSSVTVDGKRVELSRGPSGLLVYSIDARQR